MNLKVGNFNLVRPVKIGGNRMSETYERAIKELSRKYYQDVNNVLETSLSNIGVAVESLRQGELIMVPNSVGNFTDYFHKETPLFRLHSGGNFGKIGGWWIEYFN